MRTSGRSFNFNFNWGGVEWLKVNVNAGVKVNGGFEVNDTGRHFNAAARRNEHASMPLVDVAYVARRGQQTCQHRRRKIQAVEAAKDAVRRERL